MPSAKRGLWVGSALFAFQAVQTGGQVGWEDSAFFQLCHATLGVPHGPGFPLYVLAGRLFVWPFGTHAALGSNLFSALAHACAGAVLLEVILLAASRREGETDRGYWTLAGALAVVLGWSSLAANRQQAARAEVYCLALFFLLFTCYAALRSHQEPAGSRRSRQFACAAAWSWGLGMAVHPLIVAAAATPWLCQAAVRYARDRRFLLLLGAAGLPLSLYLFPLIRGRIPGVWVWGDFASWEGTCEYFTRRTAWANAVLQDGGWVENLSGWGHGLSDLWPVALWIPTLLGMLWLVPRWTFGLSLLSVFILVLWAAPYDPANLDLLGYFLPAVALAAAALGVAAVRAVRFLQAQLPGLSERSRLAIGCFLVCLAISWPAAALVSAAETRPAWSASDWLLEQLDKTLPLGATFLVTEDNLLGRLEYATRVRGFRPDLNVIAVGALRNPFYRRTLATALPAEWVKDWEFTRSWNQLTWEREVGHFLASQRSRQNWFSQVDHLPGVEQSQITPAGLVLALVGDTSEAAWEAGLAGWRALANRRLRTFPERDAVGRWIFNFGALALARGHDATGWEAMLLAAQESPQNPEIFFLLGRAFARAGKPAESRAMFEGALELAPYRQRYRNALAGNGPALAVEP